LPLHGPFERPSLSTQRNLPHHERHRGQPTIDRVLPDFLGFMDEPGSVLVAHNAPFDIGFIATALGR